MLDEKLLILEFELNSSEAMQFCFFCTKFALNFRQFWLDSYKTDFGQFRGPWNLDKT